MKRWEIENRDYQAWLAEPALVTIEKQRKENALRRARRWVNSPKNAGKKPPTHIAQGLLDD